MPDHAPLVTTLRPGILIVEMDGGRQEFAVTGGFAQVSAEGATVLADEALPKAEMSPDLLAERISSEESRRETVEGPDLDELVKRIADLQQLRDALV